MVWQPGPARRRPGCRRTESLTQLARGSLARGDPESDHAGRDGHDRHRRHAAGLDRVPAGEPPAGRRLAGDGTRTGRHPLPAARRGAGRGGIGLFRYQRALGLRSDRTHRGPLHLVDLVRGRCHRHPGVCPPDPVAAQPTGCPVAGPAAPDPGTHAADPWVGGAGLLWRQSMGTTGAVQPASANRGDHRQRHQQPSADPPRGAVVAPSFHRDHARLHPGPTRAVHAPEPAGQPRHFRTELQRPGERPGAPRLRGKDRPTLPYGLFPDHRTGWPATPGPCCAETGVCAGAFDRPPEGQRTRPGLRQLFRAGTTCRR